MSKNGSKIPGVLNKIWEFFIKECKKNITDWNKKLITHQVDFDFLDEISSNSMISKFQWEYESNGLHNLLNHYYIPSFLLKIWYHAQKLKVDEKTIDNSQALKNFFDKQFTILENEILLSDKLEYHLYIPSFRIHFPDNSKEFIFDSNHKVVDISHEETPYGINEFKEIPMSWNRRWDVIPNASFEVRFYIKKRAAMEDPYDNKWHPIMPSDTYSNYNIFIEKLRSIFEFFLCYSQDYDLSYLTFSDKFYIKQPPFSDPFNKCQIYFAQSEFPTAKFPMYFSDMKMDWIQIWKNKYDWFYTTFYEKDPITTNNMIFRYSLEVLRTLSHVSIERVKNLLLISAFEGLLLSNDEKEKKKIIKRSKAPKGTGNKGPAAKVFIKLSEKEKIFWQPLFQGKYPLNTPLTKFKTENDLYEFIVSAFNYRNNIAHANIGKKLTLEPTYLKPSKSKAPDEFIIDSIISQYFPHFIIFIIRTWLKYNKTSSQDWINFIISLL